jgi:phenylacetate-CoA ligase
MAGQDVRAAPLDRSEPIETASLDELRALQLKRLKQTLARATAVPQYRNKFAAAGVAAEDFTSFDDLKTFPLTTKEDLRQNYPFGMFAVPMRDVVRIHASSGTTGKPTVVGYTRGDIKLWSALMARSIRAAGGRPGDKMHIAYGYGLFTGGLGVHYGAEYLGCTVIPVSGGFTERQVQLIVDFKPDLIAVTPSYLLAIADEFDRQGIDARQSCATPGPIIDPETGEVLPDGSEGELVLTAMTKEAMPVIRYATHGARQRTQPRHAYYSRRQCLSELNRGGAGRRRGVGAALYSGDVAPGSSRRTRGDGRGESHVVARSRNGVG